MQNSNTDSGEKSTKTRVTPLCVSSSGTSSGTMACWDMRFQLPISNHSHPARARIRRLLMHPLYQSSVIAGERTKAE